MYKFFLRSIKCKRLGCGVHGCGYIVHSGSTKAVLKSFSQGEGARINSNNFRSAYGLYHVLSSRNGGYCPGMTQVYDVCEVHKVKKQKHVTFQFHITFCFCKICLHFIFCVKYKPNLEHAGSSSSMVNHHSTLSAQKFPLDYPYIVFEVHNTTNYGIIY